ncbi:FG-GAP repeat-containing protein [Balamuthia mandrillaris]
MTTAFPGHSLPGFHNNAHGKWADFNQDGFPDLLAWGQVGTDEYFVRLWRNNQGRNFTDVTSDLPALAPCQSTNDNSCMMEWGDFDGDNRVDLFIAYSYISDGARTVCLNNGDQPTTFTEVDVSATFASTLGTGEVRAGDVDGDGKDDLVCLNGFSGLYRSNGDGTFTDESEDIFAEGNIPFPSLQQGSADWGDVNGDQRLDLVVCGMTTEPFSAVFVQTEAGQLRDSTAELFPGGLLPQVSGCAVRFVDYDDVTGVEFGSPSPFQAYAYMAWVDADGNRSPDFSSISLNGVIQLQRNTRAFPQDESSSSSSSPSNSLSSSSASSSESNESDDRDSEDDSDNDEDDLWWQVTVPVVVVVFVGLCVVVALLAVILLKKKKKSQQSL